MREYSGLIGVILFILGMCSMVLTTLKFFLMRQRDARKFRRVVKDALMIRIMSDLEKGESIPYRYRDFDAYVWSERKIIYTFWTWEFDKMFYDSEFREYILPWAEVASLKKNQNAIEELYKYKDYYDPDIMVM
jgi:hypothetical protein